MRFWMPSLRRVIQSRDSTPNETLSRAVWIKDSDLGQCPGMTPERVVGVIA
jgi:hypothetical protein